jgi:RNA recognition motif-containing protein
MGMNLMGNTLYIRRSAGIMPVYSITSTTSSSTNINGNINLSMTTMNFNPMGTTSGIPSSNDEIIKQRENNPSKVICFKNMINLKEIEDEDEYDDLYDDVMEECKNYGKVIQVKIPRPDSHETITGLGKVFVEYATRDGAAFAKEHLQGKNFRGRKVEVVYFPEDLYKKNQLD